MSTDRQSEKGFGLDVQQQAVKAWARASGHRLVKVCSDEGLSGTKDAADRPGLRDALNLLQDGAADALIVPRLDRLARSLSVQEAALAHAWRSGARTYACDAGEVMCDDADDPMRTALRQMMGVFSQLERSMLTARMRAGRQMKADKGGYAFGSPPLGYEAHDGALVAKADEQATVERIMSLHQGGKSLRQIAEVLAVEGRRPKRSERWHPQTLAGVIKRQAG
ncbi:MAG: recombinase family protein [Propionibacteriales bacterium]|nr:recombinase family protein [Propionibacteriales bacterium]